MRRADQGFGRRRTRRTHRRVFGVAPDVAEQFLDFAHFVRDLENLVHSEYDHGVSQERSKTADHLDQTQDKVLLRIHRPDADRTLGDASWLNKDSVTFEVTELRLEMIARGSIRFPRPASNLLRGQLGRALKPGPDYACWFAPRLTSGPSGLREAPRPFVIRARNLDGIRVGPGEPFSFGLNVFDAAAADRLASAFDAFAELRNIRRECIRLGFESSDCARVRVRFLSPTELKGAVRPDFRNLFARIRDRVSTLRAMYQEGPLEIDFKAMGARAARVAMTRCEIAEVTAARTSRATGETHSLGGFTGVVEYGGELDEFFPYLKIAEWTGVGRQTVWGKGEIACEAF